MEVAAIYSEFHQSLLSFIRSKIRSKEDAEDIVQNVFIKISSNIEKLADEEKLQSWIFAITRNAIIDYYRTNASKKNTSGDMDENIIEESALDSTKGLEQCMAKMINLLPDDYRQIIIESEINGIKQKDLADQYGMAYPSMRSRVQRGRERLKQLFYNCCHIETDRHGNVLEASRKKNGETPCSTCQEN
jgi:RNA polymerase sigma-70 factor, ECF subfamily